MPPGVPAGSEPPPLSAAPPAPPSPPTPPPPPFEPVTDTEAEPAEIAIIKKASAAPFKPPPGKPLPPPPPNAPFPPPPAAKGAVKTTDQAYIKKVKKLAIVGGGALGLLLVLGLGGLWAYNKFLKPEPPPPPKATPPAPKPQDAPAQTAEVKPADPTTTPTDTKPADAAATTTDKPADTAAQPAPATDKPADASAAPQTALGQAVATTKDTVAKVDQGRTAAANEVIASDSPAPKPDEAKPVVEQKPAGAEAKPAVVAPKPGATGPAPSQAFKAWVADLKNVSVRGGAAPRVFIGGITYPQGEVVNPQLGIVFEGYDDKRKMIIFRDKSGARVERRR